MLTSLLSEFTDIVTFDVETTGIDPKHDEIIEIGMLRISSNQYGAIVKDEYSTLIRLSAERYLLPVITNLTGITDRQLLDEGISKASACEKIVEILDCSNPLIVAFNAQFDLCFLYYFLSLHEKAFLLKNAKMLDALTIFKDRKPYPHKLSDAVQAYSLSTNTAHRALGDAKITYELLCKMENEYDDLFHYVNLFGFNPKYGITGTKISSIRYLPQEYNKQYKLYEM